MSDLYSTGPIVLARTREEIRVKPGTCARIDVGHRHLLETYLVADALIWVNSWTEEEETRARRHAEKEGYLVFVYPVKEADPLGRAKREILGSCNAATPDCPGAGL